MAYLSSKMAPATASGSVRCLAFSHSSVGAAAFFERHTLSLTKIVVLDAFEARGVKEQILRSASVNETEAFVGDSFNRAFCHLLQSKIVVVPRDR